MTVSADEKKQRLIAAALNKLNKITLIDAFDPLHPESRPTVAQKEVLDDFGKIPRQWIVAANQCQPGSTLIMTPKGPCRLDSLHVGDFVYSEHGVPVAITAVWDNGLAEVADLTYRGAVWGSCTANHVWQVKAERQNRIEERRADKLSKSFRVCRNTAQAPLGDINEPHAYVIAALLGDGCGRYVGNQILISSANDSIPKFIASELGCEYKKTAGVNYTWVLKTNLVNHYDTWCKRRYAHEKIVDLEVIKTWNRTSLLKFVAGLIDTDGSIYPSSDHITFSIGMQAKPVVDALEYAVLALWQIPLSRGIDNRAKYKNGPIFTAYTRNANFVRTILLELNSYIISPQKKYREAYAEIGGQRTRNDLVGVNWGSNMRIEHVYDITVDSPTSLYLLANGLISHNSGKSATGARLATWVFTETHPSWKRPQDWQNEKLLILVMGRTGKQLEESLWPKMKSYLEPGTYKEVRLGNILQKVESLTNGNIILFQSLENANIAAERIQSYVAHMVWVDEMPPTIKIIDEALRRVQAKAGMFLATFTPLVFNEDIRRMVDGARPPHSKRYTFKMFDNPIYTLERQEAILEEMKTLPLAVRETRLNGAWSSPDNTVYYFNYDSMVEQPPGYHPGWRHLESSDPATKSKHGLIVLAENPSTGIWYVIRADYLTNLYTAGDLIDEVNKRIQYLNITRRVADPAESWYIGEASKRGIHYMTPYNKNNRKSELTKQLQAFLGPKVRIAPWCNDLITELQRCRWADQGEGKIVNANEFHLIDATQYGIDCLPKFEGVISSVPWQIELRQGNSQRKKIEAQMSKLKGPKKKFLIRKNTHVW